MYKIQSKGMLYALPQNLSLEQNLSKANETEDQRQQRLDNAAIKIQASHRGKMGRKRAEVVERLGLVGLQQLKEQKRQDLLAAQIAEEEAMQARSLPGFVYSLFQD